MLYDPHKAGEPGVPEQRCGHQNRLRRVGTRFVYKQFGSIHVFDPSPGSRTLSTIQVTGDFQLVRRTTYMPPSRFKTRTFCPRARAQCLKRHGENSDRAREHGDIRNLTIRRWFAERDPAWSPKWKWIAYFSDESGEYALPPARTDGMGEVRQISLGNLSSFFYSPTWSPDKQENRL